MKGKHIFIVFAVAAIVIIIISVVQLNTSSESYVQTIKADREEKNEMFKNSDSSPLTDEQKHDFTALKYFPIDPSFNIQADFHPTNTQRYIKIAYSDGSEDRYLKYGYAEFVLKEKKQRLLVLKPVGPQPKKDYLFLPFYDETSTFETYGSGRYVEPEMLSNKKIRIDLNTAYNPYCAYNENYSCPLPPKENNINVKVTAGEKKFHLK